MRKYTITHIDGFYCHVYHGGGLMVDLISEDNSENLQFLTAEWIHFENRGPSIQIPLLTTEQIDGMIRLLEKARSNISTNHSYRLGKPEFISDKQLKDILE